MPLPLGRRWLGDHLDAYYGRGRSLLLERQVGGGDPVPIGREKVRVCDLSDVPGGGGAWAHEPPPGEVAVDPVLGRVYTRRRACAAGERLLGTSCLRPGRAGRRRGLHPSPPRRPPSPVVVALAGENLQPHLTTVAAGGTVEIADNDVYPQSLTVTTTAAPAGQPETELHLVAGAGVRPSLVLATSLRLDLAPRTTVVLDGLLLSGGPLVLDEVGDTEPRTVVLRNCTLVPGHARTPDGLPKQADRAQPARARSVRAGRRRPVRARPGGRGRGLPRRAHRLGGRRVRTPRRSRSAAGRSRPAVA